MTATELQTTEEKIEEILDPLVELLDSKYQESKGSHSLPDGIWIDEYNYYQVTSDYSHCLVMELPVAMADHPALASTLATLLQRSGTNYPYVSPDRDEDEESWQRPLRFCLVKKAFWIPDIYKFDVGMLLVVEAGRFDRAATERQVALLVEYLSDDANLIALGADELRMF